MEAGMVSRDWGVCTVSAPLMSNWLIGELNVSISHGIDIYWAFRRAFRNIILSSLPPSFGDVLRAVLAKTFADANKSSSRLAIANALDQMGILDDFKSLINNAVATEIERFVAETCPRVRMEHQLPILRAWFNGNVKPWMTDVFGKGGYLTLCISTLSNGISS